MLRQLLWIAHYNAACKELEPCRGAITNSVMVCSTERNAIISPAEISRSMTVCYHMTDMSRTELRKLETPARSITASWVLGRSSRYISEKYTDCHGQ